MQRISSLWREHIYRKDVALIYASQTATHDQISEGSDGSLPLLIIKCFPGGWQARELKALELSTRIRSTGYADQTWSVQFPRSGSCVDSSLVWLKLTGTYLVCASVKLPFHDETENSKIDGPLIPPWSVLWWMVAWYACRDWSGTLTTLRRGCTTAVHGKSCFCLLPRALLYYRKHCCAYLQRRILVSVMQIDKDVDYIRLYSSVISMAKSEGLSVGALLQCFCRKLQIIHDP